MTDLADRLNEINSATHDSEAERIVLGAMLRAPGVPGEVADAGLEAAHFVQPRHAATYRAVQAARAAGIPTEPTAIAGWLADQGELASVGGAAYLADLLAAPPLAGTAEWYARRLIELASRRELIAALTRAAQAAAGGATSEQLHKLAEGAIREAAPRPTIAPFTFLGDYAQIGLRDVEMRKLQGRGIPTGFVDLDRLLGGFRPGQLIVFAGRPGMGKSTVGLDIARHTAIRCGLTTAFISLEMTMQELFDRALAAEARIPYLRVRDGELDEDDWGRASMALGPMADAPLGIADPVNQTVTKIGNRLRAQARTALHLAIVDHLGLIKDPSVGRRGRQEEVAQIVRDLKNLAKDLAIPIVLLVQLNREAPARADKTPQLTDLRESGEIEQSADIVVMVHRDDYYEPGGPRAGEADLIVRKNRGGPTDRITVAAQLHFSRFVDMSIR